MPAGWQVGYQRVIGGRSCYLPLKPTREFQESGCFAVHFSFWFAVDCSGDKYF